MQGDPCDVGKVKEGEKGKESKGRSAEGISTLPDTSEYYNRKSAL